MRCSLQEMHFTYKITDRLKVKKWGKICHGKSNYEKACIILLISNTVEWKQGILLPEINWVI